MKSAFIADLEAGRRVSSEFLLQGKERKNARSGSAYLDLDLRDSTGTIKGKLWDCDRISANFEIDDVVHIEGAVERYQGTLQIAVRDIRACGDGSVDLLDLLPRSKQDPEVMYAALLGRVRSEPEGPLKQLLLAVLEDPALAAKYKLAPAAMVLHHAYLGGLLEHVSSLWRLADKLADHYPWLNRSLMFAGIVLHDLGKVEELSFQRAFRYSTRGQLLGHISIALELVQEKIRGIPGFPATLKAQVEHIILSHHGKLEFGSPKEPMFAEALAVHYLDELDSKLESVRAQYETERNRLGDWTSRNRALGRELLKTAFRDERRETGDQAAQPGRDSKIQTPTEAAGKQKALAL
jgi:3'-5' exoribonuclease